MTARGVESISSSGSISAECYVEGEVYVYATDRLSGPGGNAVSMFLTPAAALELSKILSEAAADASPDPEPDHG